MIRAIRPSAVAHDDASIIAGWNIAPNMGYTVTLSVSASAVVAILSSAGGAALIGSGVALVGTDQPVTIHPVSGQTVGMVDADLGWHLLVTTDGTEGDRSVVMDPMVDLADEIHPIYTDSDMALARATAAINAGACYVDDVSVACPLGIGAGLGAVASAPVEGVAVVGQVESVTWSGTPDGTIETAVIRRHTAIAPAAYTPPAAPPVLADDVAETDAATATSGNVLDNDDDGLNVTAVNGISSNVGVTVAGSNGGEFAVNADGSWTFDPDGDFSAMTGSDTATTSVTYHASDGVAEAGATLTVTVSAVEGGDPYWGNVALYIPMTGDNGSMAFGDVLGHSITRYAPMVINTGDGPQDVASYGVCNVSSTGAAYKALSVVGSESLHVGSSDFCVDFFVRFNSTPNTKYFSPVFFAKRFATTSIELQLALYAGNLMTFASANGTSFAYPVPGIPWAPTIGVWYYIRLNRSGNTWRLYIDTNKVAQAEWANTVYSGTAQITLLGDGANAMESNVSMSYFRWTIGSSRETTDTIVIPTLPYPLT